jgi:hypothetical protein
MWHAVLLSAVASGTAEDAVRVTNVVRPRDNIDPIEQDEKPAEPASVVRVISGERLVT